MGWKGSGGPSSGWVEMGRCGSAVYYLSWCVGVSCSIWFQICGNWYFPMFLLSEGSFTWMNMASLIFLVLPCGSLCIMVKQSGPTGCPVVLLCWWMRDGALRCSFTLSLMSCQITHPNHSKHSHTPYTAVPIHPYSPISVAPSLVGILYILFDLTFSLIPDELATVWWLQRLVSNILWNCFASAYMRYYIMEPTNDSNLFS